ncbi:MAG: HIT family protein [Acidobacteriota bacterium]|nr:MAG: HIT family protein [Acidobacteriota bacterium]
MNTTMSRFGYPETLVAEYTHWAVLLRPQQVSLGSLVLVSTSEATAFSELDATQFIELRDVIEHIEGTLGAAFKYQKLNYLMLMMVDPHVHFHVIPRYADKARWEELVFIDHGWPGPPDLSRVNETGSAINARLVRQLRERWPLTHGETE